MKTIPKEFKRAPYLQTLIKRENDLALYELTQENRISGYEVHKIRIQKARSGKFNGVVVNFEEKERLANSNEFGSFAWSYASKEEALKHFLK